MPHRTNWDEVASTTQKTTGRRRETHLLHVLAAALPLCTRVSALPSSDHQHRDGKDATFYKGLDLSSVATLEERGVVYKDTQRNNRTRPVEDILGDGGMDTVRLRCDHAIVATPNSRPQVRASPRRAARPTSTTTSPTTGPTPGHNDAPLAWPTDLAGLSSTLRACVKDTLVAFAKGGVDLSLVSLGDEMRNGMLWPLGRVDVDLAPAARVANLSNLATLYASARGGVDDALQAGFRRPQATIHIDNGWDETLQEAWFGALTATGRASRRDWDVLASPPTPSTAPARRCRSCRRR
ncbi:hypothetical protein LTR39_000563 [Cryomyces antarcticus]|nr:hypothetical protein LTR39_000563 [Cryomyces antarcticus]